jgi:hypothetical protein
MSANETEGVSPQWPDWLARPWVWYYRNFLRGFCYYLPLLLLFLFPLAILFGSLGADYGPRLLFLQDDKLKSFVAGVSLTLFWAEVLFVGYLLWLRDHDEGRLQGDVKPSSEQQSDNNQSAPPLKFRWYCLCILGCMVTTLGVFGLVVWIAGQVFDVFDIGTTVDVSAWFQNCLWLLSGVVPTVLLFLGARWLYPILVSLRKYLAVRFGHVAPGTAQSRAAPGEQLSSSWANKIARWVFGSLILSAWVIALLMVLRWVPWGWKFYGSVFFVAAGLVLTFAAPFTEPRQGTPPKLPWPFFSAALVSNLIFVYAMVSWSVSNCPYGFLAGLLATASCGLLLVCATYLFCQSKWEILLNWCKNWWMSQREWEQDYLFMGVVLGMFITGFLLAMALIKAVTSGAVLAVCLLFGIVVLYAAFTYLVRRAMIVVLGGVVLLALVSHIQPYQMRFPELDYVHIVDLQQLALDDRNRQDHFDESFQLYRENENALVDLDANISYQQRIIDNESLPELVAKAKLEKERLLRQRQQKEVARDELTKKVREAWQEMEQKNRIRAGRFDTSLMQENLRLRLDDEDGSGRPRPLRTEQLKVWRPKGSGANEPEPLVVIAVSGGGIRAAVWTFRMLMLLELKFAEHGIDFPSHVRMITGASGGMLGASYYVVTLPAPEERPAQKPMNLAKRRQALEIQLKQLESSDFLTPLAERLVFNDIPGWLSPWPARLDRGQALQEAWDYYLKQDPAEAPGPGKGALNVTFESLREDEKEGRRPSLVFAPMMIEDGRRLIVSNLDLRWVISNDAPVVSSKGQPGEGTPANPGGPPVQQYDENLSIEALELFRLFPETYGKMTVATATRMSASFPYFSPAISLPAVPRRRVVDAGYYDNYGVSLTAAWLLSEDNQQWIKDNSGRRILFIQIRDGVTEDKRRLLEMELDGSNSINRCLEELTSPPQGLLSARVSSSSFRNDEQLELLGQVGKLRHQEKGLQDGGQNTQKGLTYESDPYLIVTYECQAQASLSWRLSKREQDDINRNVNRLSSSSNNNPDTPEKFDRILKWWGKKGPPVSLP